MVEYRDELAPRSRSYPTIAESATTLLRSKRSHCSNPSRQDGKAVAPILTQSGGYSRSFETSALTIDESVVLPTREHPIAGFAASEWFAGRRRGTTIRPGMAVRSPGFTIHHSPSLLDLDLLPDANLLHPLAEGRAGDAEQAGGLHLVALGFFQRYHTLRASGPVPGCSNGPAVGCVRLRCLPK